MEKGGEIRRKVGLTGLGVASEGVKNEAVQTRKPGSQCPAVAGSAKRVRNWLWSGENGAEKRWIGALNKPGWEKTRREL